MPAGACAGLAPAGAPPGPGCLPPGPRGGVGSGGPPPPRGRARRALVPGMPAAGLGEELVADLFAVAADVVDAARDGERRQQRPPGVLGVQRGPEARVGMILAGARAVEQPE